MKTHEAAAELASACVRLASKWGRRARAAVTDMSQPLGSAIGNALDVAEAVRLLKGEERGRLRELSVAFAAETLWALEGEERLAAAGRAEQALDSGSAAEAFARMIEAQGGDAKVVDDPWAVLPRAAVKHDVRGVAGYLAGVDAEALGRAAAALGAGRWRKGDVIDPAVGIEFLPKIADRLERGATIAMVHVRSYGEASEAERRVLEAADVEAEGGERPPRAKRMYGEPAEGS